MRQGVGIDAMQKELERAFQMLEANGVPRERAKSVANGIDVLATRFAKTEQALADTKEENERLTNRLAAEGRAWDILIGCCYDELKKALGRDIECPAYIPDAIKELAALRGEELNVAREELDQYKASNGIFGDGQ